MKKGNGRKLYQSNLLMWACLILFPPVGLILLWVCHGEKKKLTKIVLTVVFAFWSISLFAAMLGETNEPVNKKDGQAVQIETVLPTESLPQMTESVAPPAESQAPEQRETDNVTPAESQSQPTISQPPEKTEPPSEPPRESEVPPTEPPAAIETVSLEIPETPAVIPSETEESPPPAETGGQPEGGSGGGTGGGNGENFNTYDDPSQQETEDTYVLNTDSMKFHKPSCRAVKKIAPENYDTTSQTRTELIGEGYSPCGICHP